MRRWFFFLLTAVAAVTPLRAQAPKASDQKSLLFEVASIKPNTSHGAQPLDPVEANLWRSIAHRPPRGRLHLDGVTTQLLIEMAYDVPDAQLVGGASWVNADRYEVDARTSADATPEQVALMLRSLLTERFKLAVRRETRGLSVYELREAKGGPKASLVTQARCENAAPPSTPPTRPVPGVGPPPLKQCGGVRRKMLPTSTQIEAVAISMHRLIELLAEDVDRTIIDKSRITVPVYVRLEYTPTRLASGAGDSTLPSLFTALEEQLGLKLEPAKAPVDVLVIDHVEKPTPD